MKATHKYLIIKLGILKLIALKNHSSMNFYKTVNSMLYHKWTNQDIENHLLWQLNTIKEHVQY